MALVVPMGVTQGHVAPPAPRPSAPKSLELPDGTLHSVQLSALHSALCIALCSAQHGALCSALRSAPHNVLCSATHSVLYVVQSRALQSTQRTVQRRAHRAARSG